MYLYKGRKCPFSGVALCYVIEVSGVSLESHCIRKCLYIYDGGYAISPIGAQIREVPLYLFPHCFSRVYTPVSPGDLVQINPPPELMNTDQWGGPCVIDGSNCGSVIVSPDLLITPTAISTSVTCPRKYDHSVYISAFFKSLSVCVNIWNIDSKKYQNNFANCEQI